MSPTAMTCETARSAQHYLRSPAGSGGERAGHCAGTIDLMPDHRSVVPLESHPIPELQTPRVASHRADHGSTARLLLIGDDGVLMSDQLRRSFPAPAYRVQGAHTVEAGLEHIRLDLPDVIVLDLGLPDQSGLGIYQQIRRIHAHLPVIVIAGARRADAAIEPIKQGAYDCLFKPLDLPRLRRVVAEALDVARRIRQPAVPEETGADLDTGSGTVGSCPAMMEVYKAIGRVADQTFPVLITGESGTGKELVALAVYQHGLRAKAPFVALNCAAIPETLLESELFGHEKGAFTGAERRRIGKFEQCNGGTLVLDEVGDMPLPAQAKLLRVLQEQAFERVGGSERIRTDVRVIAATHRNLKAWSDEGKFRLDLYYRLGVFTIHLPPLRERDDDLPMLVHQFLSRFSRELGREIREIDPDALEVLRQYSWPGNVRELQSVLKQALLKASGTTLLPAFLPELSAGPAESAAPDRAGIDSALGTFISQRLAPDTCNLYAETHGRVDRLLLPLVLRYTKGNQLQAARLMGICRRTLRQKLVAQGLRVAHLVEGDEDSLS